MSDSPLVSIIIVNYNGKNLLKDCLESIKKIDYTDYEVILVDNNSSDDSIEFVKENYPKISIIKLDSNLGFAYPNNIGAKKARGEFLLFLNNDTVVKPNFLSELLKPFALDPKIAVCQSLLIKPNGDIDSSGDFIDSIGIAFSYRDKPSDIREIFSAKAAAMLVRHKIFKKVEGFDEKFFATFEDIDLCWRIRTMGYSVIINPKSIVYHIGGQTIKKSLKEIAFHGLKNQLSLKITNFESYHSIKSMVLFFLIYGFREIRILSDYIVKDSTNITATKYEPFIAQKPSIKIVIKSILWILSNYSYLLQKRKKINSLRVTSTNDMRKQKIII